MKKKKEKTIKNKQTTDLFDLNDGNNKAESHVKPSMKQNIRTLRDCFAPSEVEVIDRKTLKVGNKYFRNYVMQGFPTTAYVGWLNGLYQYDGNMDTVVMVEPSSDREALNELTKQITSLQAQYAQEAKEGKESNLIAYQTKINNLTRQRAQIEQNNESMFRVGIFSNLCADSIEELERRSEILESDLKGRRVNFIPTNSRMVNGFKTALPLNYNFYKDKMRNFNTGAVVACMPFTRGEICDPNGVLLGRNALTGNNIMIDFYNKKMMKNTNIGIFGRAGSGKSFFTMLLTMRSALKGIMTAIIDPEGEYGRMATYLGGANVELSSGSRAMINPFEIDVEIELDDDGKPTGRQFVNLEEKYGDLLDLICIMAGDTTQEEKSLISSVIVKLYQKFNITMDKNSLYEKGNAVLEDGTINPLGRKKRMPQFTDFYNLLSEEINYRESINPYGADIVPLRRMQNKLLMYCKGQAYPIFDCQSTVDLSNFASLPIINFDVSKLEESTLRPIGMYVVMSFVWEKIVKKNIDISKRVICDEAWMLLNKSYPGFEYTSGFLEKCARRIRKRNAGLLVASQSFVEFTNSDQGNAVLNNLAVKCFLKQNETDIDALQQKFRISDGEKEFLLQAAVGQALIKTDNDVAVCNVQAFPIEEEMIRKSRVH